MNWIGRIPRGLRALLRRRQLEADMDEEIRLHVELKTQANIKAGMDSEEARCAALRQFGQPDLFKEHCRDQRGITWLEDLGKDICFALRVLGKNRGFTAIAISTLAIGLGAATAIYSVLDAFAIHPVPGPYADRLSEITEFNLLKSQQWRTSPVMFKELSGCTNYFEKLALYDHDALTSDNGDFLKTVAGAKVTPGFFNVLGAKPLLGRTFTPEDGNPGQDRLLVISYGFWHERFEGRTDVVGTTVRLQDKVWTIIGVMPKSFAFPTREMHFWRPMSFREDQLMPAERFNRNWWCIARRQPEASGQQVEAFLRKTSDRLAKDYTDASGSWIETCSGWILRPRPLAELFVDATVRRTLWCVFGALGFLLAVICATIAGLQTARLESRQQELSIRAALGAGRWRMIRQLLIESLLLAGFGGALGLCFSAWGRSACLALVPPDAPMLKPLGFDWNIALMMLGSTVLLGAAFGILQALAATKYSKLSLTDKLKEGGTTATRGRASQLVRSGLVVGEVALALAMVVSASLLVRSVWKALEVDPGFDTRRLARIDLSLQLSGVDKQRRLSAARDIADHLRGVPGTFAVGMLQHNWSPDYMPEGSLHSSELHWVQVDVGNNDFLRASGARLLAGRWFDGSDDSKGHNTIIINERLATLCWPGQNAVGKRLWEGKTPAAITNSTGKLVVGVVKDMREWLYDIEPEPTYYEPFSRDGLVGAEFWVRTHLDHASFIAALRSELKQILPKSLEAGVGWVSEDLYASTAGKRLYAGFLSALAGLGLLLAALGIYGVLSYMVAQRIREIGVRMALGAQRWDVIKMIVSQGGRLMGLGVLPGYGFAYLVTKILRSQLFGVGSGDLLAWLGAGAVLLLAGTLASYFPARRATKVDPIVALRSQ